MHESSPLGLGLREQAETHPNRNWWSRWRLVLRSFAQKWTRARIVEACGIVAGMAPITTILKSANRPRGGRKQFYEVQSN